MTKVYEALQHAGRELKIHQGIHDEPGPGGAPLTVSRGLDIENTMMGFYNTLEALSQKSDAKKSIIQFAGSREGEGTSTITKEFALFAGSAGGKSVLLLDADRGNPRQAYFFGISPNFGLEEVIKRGDSIDNALYQVGNLNLKLGLISTDTTSTPCISNSPEIDELFKLLRTRFDLVLIDSPPITASSDGLAIAYKADGVVLVVEADRTRWTVAKSATDQIVKHSGNVLGIIFNKRRYHIPDFIYKRL
ncbi:MAG: CpsD/CapB family tyrosine-protein kinase [Pseudomonadota bacterium]